jgi:hypothetical protein
MINKGKVFGVYDRAMSDNFEEFKSSINLYIKLLCTQLEVHKPFLVHFRESLLVSVETGFKWLAL